MDARYCPSAGMRGIGDLIRIGDCRDLTRSGVCGDEPVPRDELQHPAFEPSPLEGGHHLLAMRLSFPRADQWLHSRSRSGFLSRLGPLSPWTASTAARNNEGQENDNYPHRAPPRPASSLTLNSTGPLLGGKHPLRRSQNARE